MNTINHNKQITYFQAFKGGLNITREDIFKWKLNISKPLIRLIRGLMQQMRNCSPKLLPLVYFKQLRPKTCSNEHFSKIYAEKFSLTCYTIMTTALIHTLSALIC